MKTSVCIILLTGMFFLGGCNDNREEIEQNILAQDSSFQRMLEQRGAIQEELDSLKAAHMRRIQEVDSRIRGLKRSKAEERTKYMDSAAKIKRRLTPVKEELEQKLFEMKRRIKRKRVEISDINKDIAEVNVLVNKKDRLSLTREELQAWNKRLSTLLERESEVNKDIEKLREDITLTGMKIRVLELR